MYENDEDEYEQEDKEDEEDEDEEQEDEEDEIIPNVERPLNKQTFYVSRHLRSCNNMVDDLKLNILKKIAEPSLSLWGILTGLSLKRELRGRFNNRVYVSCLLRTWMTAIIEYLPHCMDNTLTLIISPYIKEKHNKIAPYADWGNFPTDFEKQLNKIKYFFEYLKLIKSFLNDSYSDTEIIQTSPITKKIKYNLDKILSRETTIIIEFKDGDKNTFELSNNSGKLELIETTPIPRNFEPYSLQSSVKSDVSLEKGNVEEEDGEDVFVGGESHKIKNYLKNIFTALINQKTSKRKINDVTLFENQTFDINMEKKSKKINPYTNYFGKEGFFLFAEWIKNVIKDTSPDIYVVAHSKIMQETLLSKCNVMNNTNTSLRECRRELDDIRKQNIWEIILSISDIEVHNARQGVKTKLVLNKIIVREGEDPPKENSKRSMNLSEEYNCSNDSSIFEKKQPQLQKQIQQIQQPQQPQIQQQQQQMNENEPKKGLFHKMKNFFGFNKGGKTQRSKFIKTKRKTMRNMKRKNTINMKRKNTRKTTRKNNLY